MTATATETKDPGPRQVLTREELEDIAENDPDPGHRAKARTLLRCLDRYGPIYEQEGSG